MISVINRMTIFDIQNNEYAIKQRMKDNDGYIVIDRDTYSFDNTSKENIIIKNKNNTIFDIRFYISFHKIKHYEICKIVSINNQPIDIIVPKDIGINFIENIDTFGEMIKSIRDLLPFWTSIDKLRKSFNNNIDDYTPYEWQHLHF